MTDSSSTPGSQAFAHLGPLPSYLATSHYPRLVGHGQLDEEAKACAVSCADIAKHFWGEPKSATPKEWRWGTHGSRAINVEKNVWFDHEANEGGDTIRLVQRELGYTRDTAVSWLLNRQNYFGSGCRTEANVNRSPAPLGPIVATYDYVDEGGNLLFQVVKHDPKTFRQRRRTSKGNWLWSVRGVRQVPYHFPELRQAIAENRTVMVVEGDKDVDNLRALGFPSTCNAGGANKWRPELSEYFRGADVVLVPDNDEPGRLHMSSVGLALTGIARRIRIFELPGLPEKGDISDWIAFGGSAETLSALIAQASLWEQRAPFQLEQQPSRG